MNLFRYLDQIVFTTEEACFLCTKNEKEGLESLSQIVLQPSAKFRIDYFVSRFIRRERVTLPELMGQLSTEKVVIFRLRQGMRRTQFRPIFTGKFIIENDQT
ncbi:MAG: hypothetical protein AAF485_13880, partial [Chloroflexota bacterium]